MKLLLVLIVLVFGGCKANEYLSWESTVVVSRWQEAYCHEWEENWWDAGSDSTWYAVTHIDSLVEKNYPAVLTNQGYYIPKDPPPLMDPAKINAACKKYSGKYKGKTRENSEKNITITIYSSIFKDGYRTIKYKGDYREVLKAYKEGLPVRANRHYVMGFGWREDL